MNHAVADVVENEIPEEVDAIEEMRLRTWARKNYAPADDRNDTLHPIILDELARIDLES